MAYKIEDGGDHVKLTYNDDNDVRDFYQKGTFFMKRRGNDFFFMPLEPNKAPLVSFSVSGGNYDLVDTTAPVHSDADTLEAALDDICFQ